MSDYSHKIYEIQDTSNSFCISIRIRNYKFVISNNNKFIMKIYVFLVTVIRL